MQAAAKLRRGDGYAARTRLDQPRISECRKLGAWLPRPAFAASRLAVDKILFLSRLYQTDWRIVAGARLVRAARCIPERCCAAAGILAIAWHWNAGCQDTEDIAVRL